MHETKYFTPWFAAGDLPFSSSSSPSIIPYQLSAHKEDENEAAWDEEPSPR
jgi:hypothetical protein